MEKPLDVQDSTFADIDSVASWALEAVGQMQASGVMNGTGNNMFHPLTLMNASRALSP